MGVFAGLRRLFNRTPEPEAFENDDGTLAGAGTTKPETVGDDAEEIDLDDIVAMRFPQKTAVARKEECGGCGPASAPPDRMLLRPLMDNIGDLVYFKDRSSRFIAVNKAFARAALCLSDPHKAVGRTDFDFFSRGQAAVSFENEQRIMSSGEPETGKEVRHTWPDGRVAWLATDTYPLLDENGAVAGTWGIWRDVTEKRQAEDKLRSSEEMLTQAQKMEVFGQLAGGIAHDFNNMLSVIMGSAQLVEIGLDGSGSDLTRNIATVIDTAKKAADLTRELLTFARKGKCAVVELDAHDVIRSVVSLIDHTFDKRIRVLERLQAPQAAIRGDYLLLQNALLNLSLNAQDAMPDGGTLTFATDVVGPGDVDGGPGDGGGAGPYGGAFLRIKVADTGIGMDEKTKRRAFEPFFTTKPQGKGTGLGLVNVYGTVKNLGGLIDLETEENKGTTFSLYLPLIAKPRNGPVEEAQAPPAARGAGKVLVVDDEEQIRLVLAEILAGLGYTSVLRRNGDEALAFYREHHAEIGAVIIDLIMPGMNSNECIRELKRIDPQAAIIISSGYNLVSDTQQILSKGIAGFLQKPFDLKELAHMMSKVFAERKAGRCIDR